MQVDGISASLLREGKSRWKMSPTLEIRRGSKSLLPTECKGGVWSESCCVLPFSPETRHLLDSMTEQMQTDGVLAAAIEICGNLKHFLMNDVDVRKLALDDVKDQVDMVHAVVLKIRRSFKGVRASREHNAILVGILDSLVDLENELRRLDAMSMSQSDTMMGRWRLHLNNVTTLIPMLKSITLFPVVAEVGMKAEVETYGSNENPVSSWSAMHRSLDTTSEQPTAAACGVAAAIRVCERINVLSMNDVNGRIGSLEDVKDKLSMVHAALLELPFSIIGFSRDDNATLESIVDSLVELENLLQSLDSMSMFAYILQRDSLKTRCRLHLDNVRIFIPMLITHRPFLSAKGDETRSTTCQDNPDPLRNSNTRDADTISNQMVPYCGCQEEGILNIPLSKPSTTRIDFNEIVRNNEVFLISRELSDMEATQVANSLKRHDTSVTRLLLDDNKIGHAGAAAISVALATFTELQELGLDFNNIRDEGAAAISNALKTNKSLKHLRLNRNYIGDEGAIAVAEALKSNTSLQHLSIQNNHITNAGAKAIAEVLGETNRTLRQLWISHNKIGDEGAKAFAEALESESKSTLQNLSIQYNLISNAGAKAMAEALKTNKTLQILGLRNERIGNDGARAFVEALKSNSTLQNLYIETFDMTFLSQKLCDEIQRSLSKETKDDRIRRHVDKPKKVD